jgi:hypothetical protein
MELEDKIRDLAERAARAGTEEEAAALLQQLRGALHEHIESVRGKLILASSLASHTSAPQAAPEPSSSEIKKPPAA